MTKAIPAISLSQGEVAATATRAGFSGPSSWTPNCGYSVVEGLLYDHLNGEFWFPTYPIFVNTWTDYGPVARAIRASRRVLLRELRETISPGRKRLIRSQREALAVAIFFLGAAAEFYGDSGEGEVLN